MKLSLHRCPARQPPACHWASKGVLPMCPRPALTCVWLLSTLDKMQLVTAQSSRYYALGIMHWHPSLCSCTWQGHAGAAPGPAMCRAVDHQQLYSQHHSTRQGEVLHLRSLVNRVRSGLHMCDTAAARLCVCSQGAASTAAVLARKAQHGHSPQNCLSRSCFKARFCRLCFSVLGVPRAVCQHVRVRVAPDPGVALHL